MSLRLWLSFYPAWCLFRSFFDVLEGTFAGAVDQGFKSRVSGLGFRDWGLGFRV